MNRTRTRRDPDSVPGVFPLGAHHWIFGHPRERSTSIKPYRGQRLAPDITFAHDEGWKAGYGARNRSTLVAAFNLAAGYQHTGRLLDAIRVIEETLPACREEFGPRHPETVNRIKRLIGMLERQQQLERAEELWSALMPLAPLPRPINR